MASRQENENPSELPPQIYNRFRSLIDCFVCMIGSVPIIAVFLIKTFRERAGNQGGKRLLVFDAAYSLEAIRTLQIEHSITSRDLDGYFDHVWSVNPLADVEQKEGFGETSGRPRWTSLSSRHTVVEGTLFRYRVLHGLPLTNLMLAQARLLMEISALVRRENISAVRVGDPYFLGLLGLVVARLHHLPLVVRINGNYDAIFASIGRPAYPRLFRYRWLEKKIDRFVLSRANLVAGSNDDNRQFALNNGARPDRTTIFRYGNLIDPLHWIEPKYRDLKAISDLPRGQPFVISISRLERVKHPEDVVLTLVEARRLVPNLAAVLVGDGSMRRELEDLAVEKGVERDVVFAGVRNQQWIAAALCSADVVLSPMTGRALVEAALSGTPIVAYDVDWHRELIVSGESGVLVPYRDVAAMANATVELIADPERREIMGAKSREATLQAMDPASLNRQECAWYDLLLKRT